MATELDRALAGVSGPAGLTRIVAVNCCFWKQERGAFVLVDWDEIVARPLRVLAETSDRHLRKLNDTAAGPGRDRLHERLSGDPRGRFAHNCALLLKECRGADSVPISEYGPVLDLAKKVWEYAIGESPREELSSYG